MKEANTDQAGAHETIVNRLLPPRIDNNYSGSRIALWILGPRPI